MQQTRITIDGVRHQLTVAGKWLAVGPEVELPPDILPFLGPIDQVCAQPAPRYARATLYAIAGLFLSLLAIAALVKVDTVVMASGRLTTTMPPILLQPVERAIIRELHVRPGDVVHKGEVLATLDPTFARAELGSLGAQRSGLESQRDRLEAELSDRPFVLKDAGNEDQKLQLTVYQQRVANYQSRLRVFNEDIERLNADIVSSEKDVGLLSSQLSVAREVEEMRSSLLKSQNGSRLNYLDSQAYRMRAERDYQDSVNRIAELKHGVQSKLAERQAFIEDWRRQILETLASTRTQLSMIGENINKATLINDFVVVTAPVDGVVLDVAQRSVGSIMHEGEPLITIIPNDAKLVADIGIGSGDVGSIKAGDPVLIKVDAFPYTLHGMLHGRLLFIGEESFSGGSQMGQQASLTQSGGAFHRAQVELLETQLQNLPEGAHLIPGMTLRAEVKVGRRSVLAFFLSPVTNGFGEALREP